MDKNEILKRFKSENALGDERDTYLDTKANSYGILFASVTYIVIYIVSRSQNTDTTGVTMMFLSIILGNSFYKYFKDRKNMKPLVNVSYILLLVGGSILYITFLVDLIR